MSRPFDDDIVSALKDCPFLARLDVMGAELMDVGFKDALLDTVVRVSQEAP